MYQYLYTTGSTDTGSLSLDFRNDVVFTFLLVTDHAALIDLLGIHLHQLIAAFLIERCAFRAECPNIIFLFFFHHAIPPFTAYAKCKEIAGRVFPKRPVSLASIADNLKEQFSSEYLNAQINTMLSMTESNPTEAIGKAKELIESCCKTILDSREIVWDKNWDVGQLTGETLKTLKLMPKDIPEDAPAATEMRALLGNLRAIATNAAALRNHYGSGHGKSADYKGLSPRHAKLAVGSSITLVEFLWETHLDCPHGK